MTLRFQQDMAMGFCNLLGCVIESRNCQVPRMNNELNILFPNYFRDLVRSPELGLKLTLLQWLVL